jgi:thiamine biosynthesis lipoprotein
VAVRNWTAADGSHVHHLVDPVTREPARTGLVAVSVAGPDPAWNEVWSKALFLGGSESIGEEARRRGLAAWWVDERGRLGMTPEARFRSTWIAEERVG